MITTQNMVPITGAKPASNEGRLLDITGTSRDAETLISRRSRNPYNPDGPGKIPTDSLDTSTLGEPYGQPAESLNAKTRSMGTHVGCANTQDTNLGAVGYTKEQIEKARGYRERDSVRPGRRNK